VVTQKGEKLTQVGKTKRCAEKREELNRGQRSRGRRVLGASGGVERKFFRKERTEQRVWHPSAKGRCRKKWATMGENKEKESHAWNLKKGGVLGQTIKQRQLAGNYNYRKSG